MKKSAVFLAVILLLALPFQAAGLATPQRIRSLHSEFAEQIELIELDGVMLPAQQLQNLRVRAGSELRIYLAGQGGSLFFDQDGVSVPTADVTISRLRAARIELEVSSGTLDNIVESVEFAYSYRTERLPSASPYILVHFVQDFVSIEAQEFSFDINLNMAEELQPQTTLSIAGFMQVEEVALAEGASEMDISNGVVIRADSTRDRVALRIGEDIVIQAAVQEGERYYGVATLELEQSEGGPGGTVKSYTLQSINLDRPENTVHIQSDVTLYVYNTQGRLIGTTRDALPYSDHYYLINQRMQSFVP